MADLTFFNLPLKAYRMGTFVSSTPTLRVQLCASQTLVLAEGMEDPFQPMAGLTVVRPHMGQLQARGGHKRGNQARLHAYGGNLPTRARHKTAEQLEAGLGACALHVEGACDSQEHFFECLGTCHPSVARTFQVLRHECMVSVLQLVSTAGLPIRRLNGVRRLSRLPLSPRFAWS